MVAHLTSPLNSLGSTLGRLFHLPAPPPAPISRDLTIGSFDCFRPQPLAHPHAPLPAFVAACRRAGLTDLHFHDLRHTFVTRKVREGWDYKRIMAITGHKTFAVFQRYNNPSEEDIKAVVLAAPPRKVVG